VEAICPPPVTGTLAAGTEVRVLFDARCVRLLPEHVGEPREVVAA
jgi:iron(III) transport system ATP-binding protein